MQAGRPYCRFGREQVTVTVIIYQIYCSKYFTKKLTTVVACLLLTHYILTKQKQKMFKMNLQLEE